MSAVRGRRSVTPGAVLGGGSATRPRLRCARRAVAGQCSGAASSRRARRRCHAAARGRPPRRCSRCVCVRARAVRGRPRLLGARGRGPDRRWRRASRAGSCVSCRAVGDVRSGARFSFQLTSAHAPNAHKVAGRPAPPLQCPHHAPLALPALAGRPQRRRCALGGGRHSVAAPCGAAPRQRVRAFPFDSRPQRRATPRGRGRPLLRPVLVLQRRSWACPCHRAAGRADDPPCGPLRGACGPVHRHAQRRVALSSAGLRLRGCGVVRGAGSSGAAALDPRRRQPATPPGTAGSSHRAPDAQPRRLVRGRRPRWAGSSAERSRFARRRNAPGTVAAGAGSLVAIQRLAAKQHSMATATATRAHHPASTAARRGRAPAITPRGENRPMGGLGFSGAEGTGASSEFAREKQRGSRAPDESAQRVPLLGFTGYITDNETGLLHARARQYSPTLGRFINRDDYIDLIGGDPLGKQTVYHDGFSLYLAYYIPNHVDPTGRLILPYQQEVLATPDPCKEYTPEELAAAERHLQHSDRLREAYRAGQSLQEFMRQNNFGLVGNGGMMVNPDLVGGDPPCAQEAVRAVETGWGTYLDAVRLAAGTMVGGDYSARRKIEKGHPLIDSAASWLNLHP